MLISILSIENFLALVISFLVARGTYKKWQEEKIVSFEYFLPWECCKREIKFLLVVFVDNFCYTRPISPGWTNIINF